ncbi:peptidoglycan-binding domain-containing protein [Salinactinospora qingdaonensis]|uniref:Peptidoglycan binding-like domain-containing protein n=1 Tax=Salinactinospora qingdaonensis TaxID=702744 RepID=A0ABP7GIV2_9ACTN
MPRVNKPATILAAATLSITAGLTGAPAALADGPNTPASIVAEIEARKWPVLEKGDENFQVKFAEYLLNDYGYYPHARPKGVFTEDLVKAAKKFQKAYKLPVTGKIDAETWNDMRDTYGQVGRGSRTQKVRAVQSALREGYYYNIIVDGIYGPRTESAVRNFQYKVGIGVDGIVGPITFRALVTGGD